MGMNFKTKSGKVVNLTMSDMQVISDVYGVELTKEYLYENHPDWSDDKVQWIAGEARRIMNSNLAEEENIAENKAVYEAEEAYSSYVSAAV